VLCKLNFLNLFPRLPIELSEPSEFYPMLLENELILFVLFISLMIFDLNEHFVSELEF